MRLILVAPAVLIAAAIAMYLYLCHACQYAELFDDEAYGD